MDIERIEQTAFNEGYRRGYEQGKADAVSVVRCRECKYWIGHLTDDDGFDGEDECRWRDSEAPNADDFCSYGEREGE